jgi:dienelactone hydrolase
VDIDVVLAFSYFVVDQDASYRMSITRRESLRLFSSALGAVAVPLDVRLHHSLPGEKVLDRARLLQLFGAVPETAPPLAAQRVEDTDLGDVIREKVTYAVEPGERVPAFVFIPKAGPARHPGILCHHQHGGEFQVGKDGPAGLGSDPNQHYALELARRGYVTIVFDALCFNERQDVTGKLKNADYERYEAMYRLTEGKTLQGKYVWDARRALDYLENRPEVDASRLGMIGHSLGGQETLFTSAIDTRIAAAVSSCGFGSLRTLKRDRINHNYALFVPGLGDNGDYGAVLALVAPRPFLAVARTNDPIFPKDGIEETLAAARRVYVAKGASDRLTMFFEPGTHDFSPTMRATAYAWLDQWLAPAAYGSAEALDVR